MRYFFASAISLSGVFCVFFTKPLVRIIFLLTTKKYRTLGKCWLNLVHILRRQIFCQLVRKRRRNTCVFQGVFVQDDGKSASKMCAKSSDAIWSVLPLLYYFNQPMYSTDFWFIINIQIQRFFCIKLYNIGARYCNFDDFYI